MIVLDGMAGSVKELNYERVRQLNKLLDLQVSEGDIAQFLQPESTKIVTYNFDEYFWLLYEQQKINAIVSDWRWEPQNIAGLANELLGEDSIEIIDEQNWKFHGSFVITLSINGHIVTTRIPHDNPDALLEVINQHLLTNQFISFNFGDSDFYWLLVNKHCSVERLGELIGYTYEDLKIEPLPINVELPTYDPAVFANMIGLGGDVKIDPPEKVFFVPKIFVLNDGAWCRLDYVNKSNGKPAIWAGRIMPGQTFNQGVAEELQRDFRYVGEFKQGNVRVLDSVKDNQGRLTRRYLVTIVLFDPISVSSTKGMDIRFTRLELH